jgi:1,4-dihydroxy-2-naphthoate octaprenyltransferase
MYEKMNIKQKTLLWLRAIRAPFFSATSMSAVIAAGLAYSEGNFSWFYLIAAILIIAGSNCGINLINDYFDHKSGNDEVNKYYNPFSGGSRVIQDNLIKPKKILIAGIVSFAVTALMGLYFVIFVNYNLVWFGLAAIILGYFYTAKPLRFAYRGVGELVVFIKSGPLAVLGTYLLFTGKLSLEAFLVSIFQGLLVALILFINEFPDYKADKAVGKRQLVVRFGRKKSRIVYIILMAAVYLSVLIPVALSIFPVYLLLPLLTIPFAVQASTIAYKNYNNETAIIPAQAKTIILTLSFGLLFTVGYVLDKLI